MTVEDFIKAADAAAAPLCRTRVAVGMRIRAAVEASWAAVPCNTNLGIILLAAPLIAASEQDGALRANLQAVLAALTVEDARDAFAAIARANPAGLGKVAEQDVASPPSVTLLEAMRLAADRDLVARQYAAGYADVFSIGVARLQGEANGPSDWTTTLVYMDFLADYPDSHIVRKFGPETAEAVRRQAGEVRARLAPDPQVGLAPLLAFDRDLKQRGINPGTSADLTVAALLAFELSRPTPGSG